METIIKDDKDRDIIIIRNNGQMVIARFPDMQQSIKDYIISLYKDSTDEDETKLRDFLDYKTEEDEFCV